MKQPKISDLELDIQGTKSMRKNMGKNKKVKITIYFDIDIITAVKQMANKQGSPYQTLLNKIVKDALLSKNQQEDRLDQLEKEIKKIKRTLAA
ncbi:MAG: BrnA antitoxin family protein [Pseudomonadota bacterium]